MIDYKKLKQKFLNLSHEEKKIKIKEIANRLKNWSEFFAGISDMFDNPDMEDINDSILIYIYNVVMNVAIQSQLEKQNQCQQLFMKNMKKIQNIKDLEKKELNENEDFDKILSEIL